MFARLLDRLEARVGRHKGIRNLMSVIVIGTVLVYFADILLPMVMGRSLSAYLIFSKSAIMRGEIWRLFTFVFVPMESSSLLLLAISLYFYWMIGEQLQNRWGTLRFTLFYTTGILGSVISDVSETLLSGAVVLKNAIGIYGFVGAIALCLVPFVTAAIRYLAFKLLTVTASGVSNGRMGKLLSAIAESYSMALGLLGTCCMLLFLSFVVGSVVISH